MPGPLTVPVSYFGSPDDFSEAQRVLFLYRLAHNGGDVKEALDDVQVSPVVAMRAYKASPEFKAAWDEAIEASNLVLESTALRRASYTKRMVTDQSGNQVEVEDKPSDKMVTTLLKARKPEVYSDKIRLADADGGSLVGRRDALIEEILAMAKAGVAVLTGSKKDGGTNG
jgi:hypothetical protein